MRAHDLMSTDMHVLTPGEPVQRAAELMRDVDVGFVPVVDNVVDMRLQGVITDRDIVVRCIAAGRDPSCVLRKYMTSTALQTVAPDADAHEVLGKMSDSQVRRIPVVDPDNRLVGVVSQADVLLRLGPKEPLHVTRTMERISAPEPAATLA